MSDMKHYVYVYHDPVRHEPFYVGMGQGRRAYRHLTRSDKHPMTYRLQALKSLGVAPIIELMVKNLDEELACLVEQELISKFGRRDLARGPLLNLTDGGDGCNNPSAESRAKMSAARKGVKQSAETVERRVSQLRGKKRPASVMAAAQLANTGAKRSDEARARMSAAAKGRKLSPEHKANIAAGLRKRAQNGESAK